jgi:ribosomal protein S6
MLIKLRLQYDEKKWGKRPVALPEFHLFYLNANTIGTLIEELEERLKRNSSLISYKIISIKEDV